MRVVLIGAGGNSLGRTYCLWLLAEELGWQPKAYSAGDLWSPLDGTGLTIESLDMLTLDDVADADVVVVYQPLPRTLGVVLPMADRVGTPVVVDVDEPHWEANYGYTHFGRLRVIIGMLRRGRNPTRQYVLRRAARQLQTITSSPFLHDLWPGVVIPHVRPESSASPLPDGPLRIGFVGTVRPHKGLNQLRDAIARLGDVSLCITADPPDDARENEAWVGQTSLQEGRLLLESCHLSAALQQDTRWTRRQFPAKIIDAMMAGRVVLGSDLPILRWITGGAAVLVPPGDQAALVEAIARARDDRDSLQRLADQAHVDATLRFTPAVVAPQFRAVLETIV